MFTFIEKNSSNCFLFPLIPTLWVYGHTGKANLLKWLSANISKIAWLFIYYMCENSLSTYKENTEPISILQWNYNLDEVII